MARADTGGLKSAKTQIALAVLAAVALAVLYWQFFYSPMEEELQKHQANFRKLEKENKSLSEEERIQNDMLKCKPELDALNRANELMLPAEAEPVAFLRNLSIMAATAGLEQGPTKMLVETEVQTPPPTAEEKKRAEERKKAAESGKASESVVAAGENAEALPCWERVPGLEADEAAKATFVRVPFVIEVRGTFHQLMRYFWMLHEHANAGRIITVEDFGLSDPTPSSDGIAMTARFTAVGFREPDGAAAADAAEAAPRGGKGQIKEATQRREAQVEAASEGAAAGAGTPAGQATGEAAAEPADKAQRGVDRITKPETP